MTGPNGSVLSISSVSQPACRCKSLSPKDKAGAIASTPVIVCCDDSGLDTGLAFCDFFTSFGFSPVKEICALCAHAGFFMSLFSTEFGASEVIPVIPPLDSGSVGVDSSVYAIERSNLSSTLQEFLSLTSLLWDER
mgnify:CR=1 FL=1